MAGPKQRDGFILAPVNGGSASSEEAKMHIARVVDTKNGARTGPNTWPWDGSNATPYDTNSTQKSNMISMINARPDDMFLLVRHPPSCVCFAMSSPTTYLHASSG